MEDPPVEMAPVALRDLGLSTETSKRVRAAWTSSAHGRLARLDVVAASLGPLGTRSVTSPTTAAASSSESSFTSPHQGSVMDIRIDGSKEFVLSCSLDGSMAVSQATVSGQLAALCSVRRDSVGAHLQGVYSVCWYPHDNGMFVSGSQDKTVKVWDTNALEAVLTFNLEGPVYETRMSPVETSTHNLVAIAGDMHHVTLGDISSGSATHILGTGAGAAVWTCAWSCRSEWELISGSVDGQVRLWDIRRPGTRWVYDSNDVGDAARALSDHLSGRDAASRRYLEHAHAHEGAVVGCASVPGAGLFWLTTGNDGRPRLWDMDSKRHMMRHYQKRCSKTKYVRRVGFSDDGRHMFHPSENAVYVFDVMSGRLVRTLGGGHFGAVHCAAWNEKLEQLYTGGSDKAMLVWGVPFGEMDEHDAWSDEY
jgi:DNA excision repair protein ERCC-8